MNDLRTRDLAAELEELRGRVVARKEHDRVLSSLSTAMDRARRAEAGVRARSEQLSEMHSIIVDIAAWARHTLRRELPPELDERVRLLLERERAHGGRAETA